MRPARDLFTALLCLALLGCSNETSRDAASARDSFTLAVIPKGTTHEFWKSIEASERSVAQRIYY